MSKSRIIENADKGKILELLCPRCNIETDHEVIQNADIRGSADIADDYSIDWSNNLQTVYCRGCKTGSFRAIHYFSENREIEVKLYPTRTAYAHSSKDYLNVPPRLRRIYREMSDAFNFEAFTLCAAGLRAVVEGICAEKGINDGPVTIIKEDGTSVTKVSRNLDGKIGGLAAQGILTQQNADWLHQHRFMGNEAVHELQSPAAGELGLAIGIIEHVLDSLYEIPANAAELKSIRDARKKP